MWRLIIVVAVLLGAVWAGVADTAPHGHANVALVQLQACLDQMRGQAVPPASDGAGLSLRALGEAIGIGLLSILCFVPAAFVSEFITRRGQGRPAA